MDGRSLFQSEGLKILTYFCLRILADEAKLRNFKYHDPGFVSFTLSVI